MSLLGSSVTTVRLVCKECGEWAKEGAVSTGGTVQVVVTKIGGRCVSHQVVRSPAS